MSTFTQKSAALVCTALILCSAIGAALIISMPFAARAQTDTTGQIGNPSGDTGGGTPTATGAENLPTQGPTSNCSLTSPSSWFTACVWIPLMSWLGSWFLTIGGGLLRLAGTLFDVLVYNVIVNFKGTLDGLGITNAINDGWTVFRDFSNILIIGIFVFIAISIILGLKEFGQKKLIANVLIVAVLINFSLLFTKIIIDTSNFTALQIYNQMVGASGAAAGIGGTPDLSGSFLRPMGITSIWNDTNLVTQQIGQQSNSGLLAFLYGLVGGLLLLAAAAVLFYGCFLIAARAILFIFLMLTAALAFATYLVPSLARGEYGWSTWWKSLINNAVFAPLLMLFLAVSLAIVNQAGAQKISGTTLGSIIIDPTTQLGSNGWTAIIIYVIGIGLLFVSFKMASKFAGTISGFNLAAAIPALGLAAGARFAGFAARQTVGRVSYKGAEALQRRAQDARDGSLAQTLYKFGSERFRGVAKSDMNAMRTPLGAGVAGLAGLKLDQIAGKEVKGFEGSLKERAKKFAEQADKLHVDTKDQAKIVSKAVSAEIANNPTLQTRHSEAKQSVEVQGAEVSKQQKEQAVRQEALSRAQLQLERAKESRDNATISAAKAVVQAEKQNLDTQADRIKRATAALNNAKTTVQNIESEAKASAIAKGNLKEYAKEADLAATLAHSRLTNTLMRATGFSTTENDKLAQLSRKEVGEHHEKKEAKKIGDWIKEKTGEGGHGEAGTKASTSKPAPAPVRHDEHGGEEAHGGGGEHGEHH